MKLAEYAVTLEISASNTTDPEINNMLEILEELNLPQMFTNIVKQKLTEKGLQRVRVFSEET